MNLYQNGIFHCYNRGNNKQKIFFSESNYLYFLSKIKNHLCPRLDVLAYCLMPNHFHLLVHIPEDCDMISLTNNWRIMLSSYTRAINKQNEWTGSLFQQKTKSREMGSDLQTLVCLNYIHQNPISAGLVQKMEDWKFSSFGSYASLWKDDILDFTVNNQLMNLPETSTEFHAMSCDILPNNYHEKIF